MTTPKKYWFGPKTLGFGIGPKSWEGWLTILIYGLLLASFPKLVSPATNHTWFLPFLGAMTVVLVAVVLRTIEPPKRR